jgi:hypothetical protein
LFFLKVQLSMNTSGGPGDKPRDVGLKAIRDARIERGASKAGRVSGKAWLVGISTVLAVVVAAWLYRDKSLDQEKTDIQAKQRAAVATVGKEWFPLRDRIEKLTVEAAGTYRGDVIEPAAVSWDLKNVPGLYLRLRVADAQNVESIRKKVKDSARDSFTGCFLRENNPSMAAMARDEADAGTGWNDQPWNLRLAYQTTRVLNDEWVNEMKEQEDEIHLRVFAQQYEKATTEEIPHAIDIMKRAQFFLLVLDEDVEEAKAFAPDAGKHAGEITEEGLQQVVHPSRVHLVDLRKTSGDPVIMRVKRSGDADFQFAGANTLRSPYILAAMKRQVMNCNLAQQVTAAMHPEPPPAESDAGK